MRVWQARQRARSLEENTTSTAIRMWGRIREGDSLEEKLIRSDKRMWGRRQRLELLEENTKSTARLCVGIFWSNFKAGVRTQLVDRSTFSKGHPLTLPNSTNLCVGIFWSRRLLCAWNRFWYTGLGKDLPAFSSCLILRGFYWPLHWLSLRTSVFLKIVS